ncbi:MAG: response regulator [Acidobacteriota bacterium]|nr:response regulator [Acidobacteriota bacterium]
MSENDTARNATPSGTGSLAADSGYHRSRPPLDILIVEDDADQSAIYQAALKSGHYSTRICGAGAAALAAIAGSLPDLALLDVNTPGPDGYEVCRAIRAREPEDRAVTIIMVIARHDITSKLLAFAAGADDYLVKPLDVAELRTRVARWLGSRAIQRDVARRRRQAAIREIVTNVCAEVEGPLGNTVASVERLLDRTDLAGPVREELQGVRPQLDRLVSVLRRLQISIID